MALHTLHDLLSEQLRDLHNAESQYQNLLPRMISVAADPDLRRELQAISVDTEKCLLALQRACQLLAIEPAGVVCEAMRGVTRETRGTLSDGGDAHVVDAALIANAQRIAHYEIAGFGTARQFAKVIAQDQVASILDELAHRAGRHDRELTRVATGGWFTRGVNRHAETLAH